MKTLVLTLHVFTPRIDAFEAEQWEKRCELGNPNPLLLQYEGFGNVENNLFCVERIEGDTVFYYPVPTYRFWNLLSRLPNWGFQKVEAV
jgi:hypothetical protein